MSKHFRNTSETSRNASYRPRRSQKSLQCHRSLKCLDIVEYIGKVFGKSQNFDFFMNFGSKKRSWGSCLELPIRLRSCSDPGTSNENAVSRPSGGVRRSSWACVHVFRVLQVDCKRNQIDLRSHGLATDPASFFPLNVSKSSIWELT